MARGATIRPDPDRELAELKDYLGDEFDLDALHQHSRTVDDELDEIGDEQRFYRTSRGYLYDLTVFAMSNTKVPYLERLSKLIKPGARLLDYGCGIGSDGLLMLEAGYRVEFADFDNPSVEYLRWRLARRGFDAPVHDLEQNVPGGFDAAYSFDVIEHVDDPFAFLGEMESRAGVVMVNLLEEDPNDPEMHRVLPIPKILRHAAARGVRSYEVLHRRSHLVAYSSQRLGAPRRAAGFARLTFNLGAHGIKRQAATLRRR